jgi:transposase
MTVEKGSRRQFTKEFKIEAVELLLHSDKSAVEIAANLGIQSELLYRWKSEYLNQKGKAFVGSGRVNESTEQARLRQLEKEYRELQEERDILKKPWPFSQRKHDEIPVYLASPLRTSG